jgi:hypothetical protein
MIVYALVARVALPSPLRKHAPNIHNLRSKFEITASHDILHNSLGRPGSDV